MKNIKTTIAIALLVFSGVANAGSGQGHRKHDSDSEQVLYEYAQVLEVRPIYREVKISTPIRECWEEPVYHTRSQPHKSASGMLVGGLLGGIIGHQFGSGRGNKVATAAGTLIGASIGHDAVNGHVQPEKTLAGYEERCKTRHRVSYEEVLDGYDVSYEYRGRRYRIEMPYDPGEHIIMRIQFAPVI
jgi:uncharacterized protein YcfJ